MRTVASGGSLLDPKATAVVLERLRRGDEPSDPRYESLSPQERRILHLIADGLTNRQIGAEMYLAEKPYPQPSAPDLWSPYQRATWEERGQGGRTSTGLGS